MNMNEKPNKNIHCTVNDCKNHCTSENYCSLNCVDIGAQNKKVDYPECTECNSFAPKNQTM